MAVRKVPADRKPSAARRRAATVAPPVSRSLVEIVTNPEEDEDEGIPVFAIDGEVYTMPSVISASFALGVIDRMRTESEDQIIGWMLEEVLGAEAYDALKGCKSLKPEHLRDIMRHVSEHVNGAMETVRGN